MTWILNDKAELIYAYEKSAMTKAGFAKPSKDYIEHYSYC